MWPLILVPVGLVLHDYLKAPIDRLYFQNPRRPLVGMRNTIIDILTGFSNYRVLDHPGLWLIKFHFRKIQKEFGKVSKKLEKQYFHDLDPWFEKNERYYFYRAENFPLLKNLIDQIPCINKETALFAVVEGPMTIAPHTYTGKVRSTSLITHGTTNLPRRVTVGELF
jgi:hypothetical protein